MTEEVLTNLGAKTADMTTLPSIIPLSMMTADAQPPTSGEEYILWGFMHDHNTSQSGQLKFAPLYRVLPSYEKSVISPYNHPGVRHHLTAPTISQVQHPVTNSVTPNPTSWPLRPPTLPYSETSPSQPALQYSNGDSNMQKSAPDQRQRRDRASRPPYSPEITRCLKKAFINTVAQNQKLTKEIRKKIILETGLSSRCVTYWFSNRKRRPPFLGKQFQQAVAKSRGLVKNYEDFELFMALSGK